MNKLFLILLFLVSVGLATADVNEYWNTATASSTATTTGTITSTISCTGTATASVVHKSSKTIHYVCASSGGGSLYYPQTVFAACFLMVVGLYLMGGGFAFFRVTVAVVGLIFGSAVTYTVIQTRPNYQDFSPWTVLGLCFGMGVVLAGICVLFWKIAIYLLCAMAGYLFSIFMWTWHSQFLLISTLIRNIIGLGIVVLFILGLVFLEFATVIFSLSYIGAYIFVLGLDLFVKTGFDLGLQNVLYFDTHGQNLTTPAYGTKAYNRTMLNHPEDMYLPPYQINSKVYGMLSAVVGFCLVAIVWQRYYNRGHRFGLRVIKNTNDDLQKFFADYKSKPSVK